MKEPVAVIVSTSVDSGSAARELAETLVTERLEEGFKKTNETFVSVMQRLATIDEAQKKIETLTGSVVSLQELLGDKRSRGALRDIQLLRWVGYARYGAADPESLRMAGALAALARGGNRRPSAKRTWRMRLKRSTLSCE